LNHKLGVCGLMDRYLPGSESMDGWGDPQTGTPAKRGYQ
jgi:hypothetical protein